MPSPFGHGFLFRPISSVALCVGYQVFDIQRRLQTFLGTDDFFFLVLYQFIFLLGTVWSINLFWYATPPTQVSIFMVWGEQTPLPIIQAWLVRAWYASDFSDEFKDGNRAQPESCRANPWTYAGVTMVVTQDYHCPTDRLCGVKRKRNPLPFLKTFYIYLLDNLLHCLILSNHNLLLPSSRKKCCNQYTDLPLYTMWLSITLRCDALLHTCTSCTTLCCDSPAPSRQPQSYEGMSCSCARAST